jgi:GNAT superfamily N-acetyltransferase
MSEPSGEGGNPLTSEPTPIEEAPSVAGEGGWEVRLATPADVPAIAAAVRELLFELGGRPAPGAELQEAARALVEDDSAGALLVADAGERIVGFLGVSWQTAVRIPGRYGLIQELWVHPAWRSQTIGGELLSTLCALARDQGVRRIEVGLPGERFPHVQATEAFYEVNEFIAIGTRMRRLL